MTELASQAVLVAMLVAVTADGDVGDLEVATVLRLYEEVVGAPLDEKRLATELRTAQSVPGALVAFLEGQRNRLTQDDKRAALRGAMLVVMIDSDVAITEASALGRIGKAMGIGETELRQWMLEAWIDDRESELRA